MNIVAIIPARMASTRFPGKPMALIHGIPMIGHVYFRVRRSRAVRQTYVATCDVEIANYIHSIGGKAIMTSDQHERCSDRTAEAMLKIESQSGQKVDIVVMVQGDEPMTEPGMIDEALTPMLQNSYLNIVNLMGVIKNLEDFEDPNEVKVVVALDGHAIYFSREPIPSRKKWSQAIPMYKQVPIIPFRRDYLLRFNQLAPTPLECIESVDMLRILEHGEKVLMVETKFETVSVDTPEDLQIVTTLMLTDRLRHEYGGPSERE